MDKKLWAHEKFIKNEIENFERQLNNTEDKHQITSIKNSITELNGYHQTAVLEFQHERLIHLIVTLFFGALLLLSIVTMFLLTLLPATYNYSLLNILVMIITLLLFVTDVFYVRHYYQLENGTQRLYEFSKKLYELISK